MKILFDRADLPRSLLADAILEAFHPFRVYVRLETEFSPDFEAYLIRSSVSSGDHRILEHRQIRISRDSFIGWGSKVEAELAQEFFEQIRYRYDRGAVASNIHLGEN